jgi:hypothetical protein
MLKRDNREQSQLLKILFSTFLDGKVDELLEARKIKPAGDVRFAPLEVSCHFFSENDNAHVLAYSSMMPRMYSRA